jgi:DNA topoisomerase-1
MRVRWARGQAFLGCSRYPECKATAKLPEGVRLERPVTPVVEAGFNCEKCGRPMRIKTSKRGKFIACSGYPRCRNAKPIEKLEELKAAAAAAGTRTPLRDTAETDQDAASKSPAKRRSAKRETGTEKPARRAVKAIEAGGNGEHGMPAPPPGFAWTRTGKPVVETWPEGDLHCPNCGSPMSLKTGRFGPFYSCTNYPRCKTSVNLRGAAKKRAEQEMPAPQRPAPIPTDIRCQECGGTMVIRTGRTGPFLGCSNYPKCRSTRHVPEELLASASSTS